MRYPKFSMATPLAATFSSLFLIIPANSLLGRDMEGEHVYQVCYWEQIPYHYTLWIRIFWEMGRAGMIQKSPMLIILIQFAPAGQHCVIRAFTYMHGYLRHKCDVMRCSQSPPSPPRHTPFPWLCSCPCLFISLKVSKYIEVYFRIHFQKNICPPWLIIIPFFAQLFIMKHRIVVCFGYLESMLCYYNSSYFWHIYILLHLCYSNYLYIFLNKFFVSHPKPLLEVGYI